MAEFVPPTLQLTKITHSIYTYFLSYFLIIYSNNFFLPAFIPYIVSELHAIHFFNNKQIHANVIDRSMMDKTAERLCSSNWWAKIQEWFELEALFQFKTIGITGQFVDYLLAHHCFCQFSHFSHEVICRKIEHYAKNISILGKLRH